MALSDPKIHIFTNIAGARHLGGHRDQKPVKRQGVDDRRLSAPSPPPPTAATEPLGGERDCRDGRGKNRAGGGGD